MIHALVLDFDGLILDTETPLVEAWAQVHADAGLPFDRQKGYDIIGHVDIPFNPWEAFGPAADRPTLEAAFQAHKEHLIRQQPILPGIIALLDYADAQGLALAVASNSQHVHVDGHLNHRELFHRFRAIRCRDDVQVPKPAPDVYLAACRALGFDPAECIAFEDSPPGHFAAYAAGLSVVVVPNPCTRNREFPRADLQLNSLADLSPFELISRVMTQRALR